jgi:predicted O-methyltransferase YrrM
MNKIMREIARPFKRLRGAPSKPHVKLPDVDFLAPTRPLHEILPATRQTEVRLFTRLIRTHTWAMPEHELLVLGAIAQAVQPRRVFEFGTFTGGSTLVLAANSADDALLTTLDIGPGAFGIEYKVGEQFLDTRFAARIEQHLGDSRQFNIDRYRGQMDLVFVDANHTLEFARHDTRLAFEMLRPGGVIVWHDYTWLPEHAECVGVTHAVNEIQEQRGGCYHVAGTRFAIYR